VPLSPERVSPATTPYHLRASLPPSRLGLGQGTLAEEKRAQFWVSPKAAPVFDSPFISVIQRKEKAVNTRKIFILLILAALLVTTLVACGAGGNSSGKADICPDAVCFLARMLDANQDNSVSLTESLGAGNP
jgi:hypothetical protein